MKRILAMCMVAMLALTGAAWAEGAAALQDILAAFELDEAAMMPLYEEDLTDLYGIEPQDVRDFAAAVNASGIKADEIVLVEAVDEAAADRVEEALSNRYEAKLNELENYLPEEYAVVDACQVTREGVRVAMIVSPDAEALTALYDDMVK